MKRILNVISQYPGKTGSGTYLQAIIKEGNKTGHKQGLVASFPMGEIYNNENIEKVYPLYFNSPIIPFPIVGMSDIMPYESTKYSEMTEDMLNIWVSEFKAVLYNAINDFEPDLIISHHLWLLTSIVKEIAGDIKVIGICHGTDIRLLLHCHQYRDLVIPNCRKLDLVLALNINQKDQISNLYGISKNKIRTIGAGFVKDIFHPPLFKNKADKIIITYAGKLSLSKGVASLINVFKLLEKIYNIDLIIVGEGTGWENKYIKELGVNKRINFLGEVTQEELGNIFRKSDIFILPSFYEGLSLVTLEALATGLLVVVTDIPGLRSFLGEDINSSGIIEYIELPNLLKMDMPIKEELPLFEYRLMKGLETQISRVIEGYDVRDDIRAKIDSMSWENIYKKIEEII